MTARAGSRAAEARTCGQARLWSGREVTEAQRGGGGTDAKRFVHESGYDPKAGPIGELRNNIAPSKQQQMKLKKTITLGQSVLVYVTVFATACMLSDAEQSIAKMGTSRAR